jgi:UDP-N-acetylglucosamine 4,6-dehydratase/5-epimerase
MYSMGSFVDGKKILITGGTGSFGQKCTEILLNNYNPEIIRIYSRGEFIQSQMEQKFHDERLRFLIGDVRDRTRLNRAMNDVDVIIHAAALKQVPACEYNPIEAVRTNIEGTINVVDTAIDNEIQKMMLISTDKAVHPVNLYGATKMVAEKMTIQGNSYAGGKNTRFSCVRYGNVIGSRGSVIPLFREQMRNSGEITITDERMTRFWITLDQGVNFVIKCIDRMKGGEIFVPRIPSMSVMDILKAVAPDAKYRIIGIRPGEKLHEILITEDESRHGREFDDYFVIEPELLFWSERTITDGKPLSGNFRYTSDTNTKWLNIEELRNMIKAVH